MQEGRPSRTALAAAAHRAAHQVLEQGRIFTDPLALPSLGEDAGAVLQWAEERPSRRRMRLFIAARARFAEDSLSAALERGVRQLVVIGAGLDTFACRSPLRNRLRIFEVDHPATQAWKQERLKDAGIALPDSLTFVPVDFERESLAGSLAAAGFQTKDATFFTWLGVVPYLSEQSVWSTLGFIASLEHGAHVVFDYGNPPDTLAPEFRAWHDRRAAHVAELGEAWVSYFETDALRSRLAETGFSEIEDLGP
ncbi:MAG TPA: SAM-dependent methyltransferase, partial [Bryobacteraceae bacterium]|nr:SAM-dependent methyltransferase [Bryobacteraceae bacterium]